MAVTRVDRMLESALLPALRRIGTEGLPTVPRQLIGDAVTWDGAPFELVQLTVLDAGSLEIDIACDERALLDESSSWRPNSFSAEIDGQGRLSVQEAVAQEVGRTAAARRVRIHCLSWHLAASSRRPDSKSSLWCAPIDFGIADEPHLLDLGWGNLALSSENENIKGWCLETVRGPAFLVRSTTRIQWYLAFHTQAGAPPTFDQVTELAALLAFAIGQPFAVDVFQCVDAQGVTDFKRLFLPDWRSRAPSRRAPGLPAIDGGRWLASFVALGTQFLAIHHSIGSFDRMLDIEFLHTWIGAETLARWGMQHKMLGDDAQPWIADHKGWVDWVSVHESAIKACAVAGMEQRLLDRVRASDVNRPTPVQRAFRGEGIAWTRDLDEIEHARHGVTHEGSMSGSDDYDVAVNISRGGLALNVLGTIIAKLIRYVGPLSDRSTTRLPLSAKDAPIWWKSADDYELVAYCDDRPADQRFGITPAE
jgi:hypothetical protein